MLDPRNRRLFLDALRPPDGYTMATAVGTTFSLDLLALLMVPLAFTRAEIAADAEHFRPDPLLLLEAIRGQVDRVHIFCQAGQIAVPRQFRGLFAYLEPAVHQVRAPHPDGLFHPKVWALRYTAVDQPVRYRVLVSSRNLTFDRSWDTLLVLDGELTGRRNAFARNHPLGDFFAALPGMAQLPLEELALSAIRQAQDELRRVDFDVPHGFDKHKLFFWPLGLSHRQPSPNPFGSGRIDRLLVISPFLSATSIRRLTKKGDRLISRAEELAKLDPADLAHLSSIHVLHDAANPEPGPPPDPAEPESGEPASSPKLEGLHAKLYVADAGWEARVWTGSANATVAAFQQNVEFLVELAGRKHHCGIDALLGEGKGGLSSLLQPYLLAEAGEEPDALERELEVAADTARRTLVAAEMRAQVEPDSARGQYRLCIRAAAPLQFPAGVEVVCWPITMREEVAGQTAGLSPQEPVADFGPLSVEAITSFIAFAVTAGGSGRRLRIRFVLNLPLAGTPEDRPQAILRSLLKNRQQVLRYLLVLLGSDGIHSIRIPFEGPRLQAGWSEAPAGSEAPGLPIFEALVRTLHQNPEQLDAVARLVEDLKGSPEGRELLPEGFDEIWEPIWAVRKELKG